MAGKKTSRKTVEINPEKVNLGRFAGSSDEEDEIDQVDSSVRGADGEDSGKPFEDEQSLESNERDIDKKEKDSSNDEDSEQEMMSTVFRADEIIDSSAKMANAMARILGTSTKSSVVLSKTTTPLQRMQREEKEARKALKEKRQMKRERNLDSLHIPLSVATTFSVECGGRSVAKELEKERFHRRVATRGVVALFNAISSHQKSSEGEVERNRRGETQKLTKHGFLDKIKSTAAASKPGEAVAQAPKAGATWNALKEDYLMDSKKNWDEDSSENDGSFCDDADDDATSKGKDQGTRNKKRRVGGKE
mmetsp:Transcript_109825/g.164245  ORF Transcript_109825/g.164245 Transcript_109825/m.164245 type:complete len:306 (-) Transcript_109825:201-1118(-)|eukprot:CAMPEP_0117008664 /NCGR_PEP_ID=MMETSP0472-20121206/8095_1 /TAXON_ID=693140 ORGANISM="Tiarina fusus, Strain LIS" /NCGR_SAMPLE_ID=MMETSP0472 /ASSEMBLY_ACC=CAM_ASM_000603 /LENGTH=305 /DNA_ID=CAMNT_0004710761 /DNA_START=69 /DNA_END=986 /DNA_ORIENTATION=+